MRLTATNALGNGGPVFLASVRECTEADACLREGAEIIDCKEPASGALGALPHEVVSEIVKQVGGVVPVSATVGDLPSDADLMADAIARMALTGVDVVKVGFGSERGQDLHQVGRVLSAIGAIHAKEDRAFDLVGVFFADRGFGPDVVAQAAEAGFNGVMLDTADKASGSLFEVMGEREAAGFVNTARAAGLLAGLAGRLGIGDVEAVARCGADIIGLRSALCVDDRRHNRVDAGAVSKIRRAIDRSKTRGGLCPVESSTGARQPEAAAGSVRA